MRLSGLKYEKRSQDQRTFHSRKTLPDLKNRRKNGHTLYFGYVQLRMKKTNAPCYRVVVNERYVHKLLYRGHFWATWHGYREADQIIPTPIDASRVLSVVLLGSVVTEMPLLSIHAPALNSEYRTLMRKPYLLWVSTTVSMMALPTTGYDLMLAQWRKGGRKSSVLTILLFSVF